MSQPRMPQSLLSEAVEQAARAGSIWYDDLARFAQEQADRLASGDYGLADLSATPIRLFRIWAHNNRNTTRTLIDNLAILSYDAPARGPAVRTIQVAVPIPAGVDVVLHVSALLGSDGYTVASAKLRLDPRDVPARALPGEEPVTVTISCTGAPADTYAGTIFTEDGSIMTSFRVAIDEIGLPLP